MSHTGEEQGNQQTDPSRANGTADPVGDDGTNETASRLKLPHLTPIVTLGAIWAIAFAVLLVWGLDANASAKPDMTDCPQAGSVSGVPSASPSKPAQLKPRAAPVTAVPFARSRTIQFRQVEYDVTDPGKVLANVSQLDVFTGQFISSDGSQQLDPRDINATAKLQSGRVVLDVCFNRTDPGFGAPGSYLGTVSIVDPRVTRTDVTFNITMSYPWWQLVFAVFVAMLLPAILYVWFLKGSFQSHQGLKVGLLQDWIFSRTALMAVGAGFAAAIGVFSAIYAKAPAWGADWTSATGLFGATFSAFVAAATAVTAAGSDKSSPKVANGTQEASAAGGDGKLYRTEPFYGLALRSDSQPSGVPRATPTHRHEPVSHRVNQPGPSTPDRSDLRASSEQRREACGRA